MVENRRSATILIVDDQKTNLLILSRVLQEYSVVTAASGLECLQVLDLNNDIDLILLDVVMVGIDGYEVCTEIKRNPRTADIPVIFITSLNDPGEIKRGFDVGAVDYITKPFEFSEAKVRVKNHLALKNARKDLQAQNVLLAEQVRERTISTRFARQILQMINSVPPRYIDLSQDLTLCVVIMSQPCFMEGGDHYMFRTMAGPDGGALNTVFSVKDQSGHSVNCILRSILTDLIHNALLCTRPEQSLSLVANALNQEIHASGIYPEEDYFTAMLGQLNHQTLELNYLSGGHPAMLLVRGHEVRCLPTGNNQGRNLPFAFLPDTEFCAAKVELQPGDRLLFFTDGLMDIPLLKSNRPVTVAELIEIIVAKAAGTTVTAVMDHVLTRLLEIIGEGEKPGEDLQFSDDITFVGLEIEQRRPQRPPEMHLFPGDYDQIDTLINHAGEILCSETAKFRIDLDNDEFMLVLNECLLNAWKHGNHRKPDKPITIRFWSANDFHVEIEDQGTGFDHQAIVDPTSGTNRKNPSGRGLYIMKRYCDAVRWQEGGRRVVMSFRPQTRLWGYQHRADGGSGFNLWNNAAGPANQLV